MDTDTKSAVNEALARARRPFALPAAFSSSGFPTIAGGAGGAATSRRRSARARQRANGRCDGRGAARAERLRAGARHRRPCRAAAARGGDGAAFPSSPTGRWSARSPPRSPSGRRRRAPQGFAVIALGKLGGRELNYSSDVDLLFLYDPETLAAEAARGARPGGAADRPAGHRDPAEADRGRLCLPRRSAAPAVARGDSDRAAGRRGDLLLRNPRLCPGSGPPSSAPGPARGRPERWALFPRGDPSVRLAALARFRRDRRDQVDHPADPRSLCAGPGVRPRLRPEARPRRHPRDRVLRPDPPAHPWRPRAGAARAGDARRAGGAGRGGAGSTPSDAAALADAYRLLRTIEHRLQMVDDRQTHSLPAEPEALDNVARLHGLADGAALLDLLRPHVERVAAIYDTLAATEGDAAAGRRRGAGSGAGRAPASPRPAAARARIEGWRSGKVRSLRTNAAREAFEAMLPELIAAFGASPDPMRALNRFDDLILRLPSGRQFLPPAGGAARRWPSISPRSSPRAGARRAAGAAAASCSTG